VKLLAALIAALPLAQEPAEPIVHSVCDLSQSFTFYIDGRFFSQYLAGTGQDARNWGSLHLLDLSNVNLLVLTAGEAQIPYSKESLQHVEKFASSGGTVLLMADGGEPMPPGAALAARFGAKLTLTPARLPLTGPEPGGEIFHRGGTVLDLGPEWVALVKDADGRPLLARRPWQRGWVLISSRGLFGQNPDASDPVNAAWIRPLLLECVKAKPVDPKKPNRGAWAELTQEIGPLTLEYHAGTARFADAIAAEYEAVRPHLVAITGVEPSPGMIKRLLILPTGGGGFSSGERIALGAWWGNYPENRYPMIELIGHEAGHSWVLPHGEPLWNEPIATWLGIEVGRRMEMPEAQATLEASIAAARKEDPEFNRINPESAAASHSLVWGKSFYVFEELERRHGPGAMAKYFRTKRTLVPADRAAYTMDDCVAVWSRAVGEDLFPWFRSLAFDVDATRSDLSPR
jgi:hypothetical protein